jgi:hypothetical protein
LRGENLEFCGAQRELRGKLREIRAYETLYRTPKVSAARDIQVP